MNYHIEEYKTLREEIGRNQEQVSRVLEYGILISSSLLTISFTEFVSGNYRLIFLFSPSLLLVPLIYLVAHLVNTTWLIGRYIEKCLEPKLGLQWEKTNGKLHGDSDIPLRSRFALYSVAPLLFIQLICPGIAYLVGSKNLELWRIFTFIVVVIVILEFVILQWFVPSKGWIRKVKGAFLDDDGGEKFTSPISRTPGRIYPSTRKTFSIKPGSNNP